MDRKSRHKIAKSEKLVSAALQKRDENLKAWLRRWPTDARRHATAVAAIVLSGQPRIYEPLSQAWALPMLGPAMAKENFLMSIEAHLAELERRHRALEMEIAEAHAHPSIDDLQIVSLKRRKLLVKDELARLKN
jgi:hypothetical protein